ncbi:MAG: hypothetical protein AB7G54_00435 [Methyloceanibacter sp.]
MIEAQLSEILSDLRTVQSQATSNQYDLKDLKAAVVHLQTRVQQIWSRGFADERLNPESLSRELKEARGDLIALEKVIHSYRCEGDKTARQLEELQARVDAPAKIAKDYDRLLEQLEGRCYHAEVLSGNAIQTSDEATATLAREITAVKKEIGSLRAELDAQWRAAAPRKSALELFLDFAHKSPELILCGGFYFLLVSVVVAVSVVNIVTVSKSAKISQTEAKTD